MDTTIRAISLPAKDLPGDEPAETFEDEFLSFKSLGAKPRCCGKGSNCSLGD
jgi:hypothetical protein